MTSNRFWTLIKLMQDYRIMKNYFAHETAVIDNDCSIGQNTKIWHFSHIMSHAQLGENCNIGQNVVVSPFIQAWSVKMMFFWALQWFLPTLPTPDRQLFVEINTSRLWSN